jgi:hypothetical protein
VKSHDEARMIHNELIGSTTNAARRAGIVSHEIYFRVAAPGSPEGLELFGVDVWHDSAGMAAYYADPDIMPSLAKMFTGRPDATIWVRPAGDWTEW